MQRESHKKWMEKHPEYDRKRHTERKDIHRANYKKYREENKEFFIKYDKINQPKKTAQRYGLTLEQYQLMLLEANGKCKICNKEADLQVDHDHKTGKVRSMLCSACNVGLGRFGDKIELLSKAIEYLTLHSQII